MAARQHVLKQVEITRAIRAAQAAGLTIAELVATREGVRVITTQGAAKGGAAAANPWDEVLDDGTAQA